MPLKDLCQGQVVCIGPKATVLDAALLMKEKHVGDVLVVKTPDRPKNPIGILTDRDIVTKVVAKRLAPDEIKVEEVMLTDLHVACDSDGVLEATEKLENAAVRRLPVVDADGNVKGILSADDFYELLATEFGNLSRISSRQVSKEGGAVSRAAPPPH
jgi:CBS domain-containing protein